MITKLEDLVGRTIERVIKQATRDGKMKIVQLIFSDGEYCILLSENPSIDVTLMDDVEHVIPPGSTVFKPSFNEDGSLREISLVLNSNQPHLLPREKTMGDNERIYDDCSGGNKISS